MNSKSLTSFRCGDPLDLILQTDSSLKLLQHNMAGTWIPGAWGRIKMACKVSNIHCLSAVGNWSILIQFDKSEAIFNIVVGSPQVFTILIPKNENICYLSNSSLDSFAFYRNLLYQINATRVQWWDINRFIYLGWMLIQGKFL